MWRLLLTQNITYHDKDFARVNNIYTLLTGRLFAENILHNFFFVPAQYCFSVIKCYKSERKQNIKHTSLITQHTNAYIRSFSSWEQVWFELFIAPGSSLSLGSSQHDQTSVACLDQFKASDLDLDLNDVARLQDEDTAWWDEGTFARYCL